MSHQRPHRQPGDMEIGITDVFLPHEVPHTAPRPEVPGWLTAWETHRPKWLMECIAEFFGVLLYCWGGMGATTAFFVTSAAKEEGFGSLLNIALCYTFAIVLAITLTGPTSGGHLNPCMTISFAIFKGFPWRKVPQYIVSQILGAFVAGCLVYACYAPSLIKITAAMEAAGEHSAIFTPSGPAGTIALFLPPGSSLSNVFATEFICTVIIGIAVFSVLDPSNIFISPASAPIVIGLIYFVAIICFAPVGVALNTSRDLGARFAAACFWGREAFPARYTALACLTNIAGTVVGAAFQTLVLADTVRPPTSGAMAIHHAQTAEKEAHLNRILTSKSNGDGGLGRALSGALGRSITPKTEAAHLEQKTMA